MTHARSYAALAALALAIMGLALAARGGHLERLLPARHEELTAQLRDRGTVAVAGSMPWGFSSGDTPTTGVSRLPRLDAALRGRATDAVADAYQREHLDGLLVRTGTLAGPDGSVLRGLAEMRASTRFVAVYVDDVAALYEPREPLAVDPADARRVIAVARLVLSGAVAPPEALFPEALRRARPSEVAVIVRDGHEPVLWRSTRGTSVARAFLDATFTVVDRWSPTLVERYGRMREALQRLSLTVAIFYDKGVLGARSPDFLRRAADPGVWAVGYERLATWEYALPPSPWKPAPDPTAALAALARERGVRAPGHLRPELTLYRFRALQFVEETPAGDVRVFDPR